MKELITRENGIIVLDAETSGKIAGFERQMKAIKEQEDLLKDAIRCEMEAKGLLKIDDEINGMSITYVAETCRETFDSKKFKADNPDLYDEYIRMSPVKSSIRIKLK